MFVVGNIKKKSSVCHSVIPQMDRKDVTSRVRSSPNSFVFTTFKQHDFTWHLWGDVIRSSQPKIDLGELSLISMTW